MGEGETMFVARVPSLLRSTWTTSRNMAVGSDLGTPDRVCGADCLIFAGMGDVHIHARQDVTGKETFATATAAALRAA